MDVWCYHCIAETGLRFRILRFKALVNHDHDGCWRHLLYRHHHQPLPTASTIAATTARSGPCTPPPFWLPPPPPLLGQARAPRPPTATTNTPGGEGGWSMLVEP